MRTAEMEIKTISNVEDFNNWANRVNEAYQKEYLNKLQDIFARSDVSLLRKLFNSNEGGRKLWLFGLLKCMGEELVLDFIKSFARSLVDQGTDIEERRLEEQLNKKILDYDWRRLEFDKQEQKYKVRIHNLEMELQTANRLKDELQYDLVQCQELRDEFGQAYNKLGELKDILRDLMDM